MSEITVYKLNHRSERVWSYSGEVVARGETWVRLHAHFGRADLDAGYMIFRRGDLMIEWFYTDRWYNVFRVHDVDDGRLKGWYCNITRPAVITADTIAADDLALDVFISPNGAVLLLDEDEFAALALPPDDHQRALDAVEALRLAFTTRAAPFDDLSLLPRDLDG